MKRYLQEAIALDLKQKMVFLGGPRQVGKTTLAKTLLAQQANTPLLQGCYLNWDAQEDRERILSNQIPNSAGLIVLDEIHKFARWRQLAKGLFDKRKPGVEILITGSARLDLYRKGGDSLQGRYHYYRMHPLTLAELGSHNKSDLNALLSLSGFPEPFFSGSEKETRRWAREYRSRVLQEDVASLERVKEISLLELMIHRLPDLVGSPLSINALREDLQVSHATVSRWMDIVERLYFLFRVLPFGSPKIKAVKKETKHYHFDWSMIPAVGPRFENLVACHLLKWCHYLEDTEGWEMELRYFRDVEQREVDFVVLKEKTPLYFIECKTSDLGISPSLRYLASRFPQAKAVQLVLDPEVDRIDSDGIRLCNARHFLAELV